VNKQRQARHEPKCEYLTDVNKRMTSLIKEACHYRRGVQTPQRESSKNITGYYESRNSYNYTIYKSFRVGN